MNKMKKEKTIDPTKFYSLGEIVRDGLIPGIDTIPKASRLVITDKVRNKILRGVVVPRGRNVMYKVKGENIIIYLAHKDEQKS